MNTGKLIKKVHQEAHECNSSKEVHDWIDWFDKELNKKSNGKGITKVSDMIKIVDECTVKFTKKEKLKLKP